MTSTTVKTFRWNTTISSYVLSSLQIARKETGPTGVTRFQQRFLTGKYVGAECRIEATDAGFEKIQSLISGILGSDMIDGIDSAAPFLA